MTTAKPFRRSTSSSFLKSRISHRLPVRPRRVSRGSGHRRTVCELRLILAERVRTIIQKPLRELLDFKEIPPLEAPRGFFLKKVGANALEPVISRSLAGRRLQQRTDYR